MWQTKKYQFVTLFITCNEDHILWEEGVLNRRNLKLFYRDMISVSGGDGGKRLGGTSRFEINTPGQTYSYSSTLGGFNGIQDCIDTINERIQFFKAKNREDDWRLELEKERAITEAVSNALQQQVTDQAAFTKRNYDIHINPNNIEPTITRIEMFLEDGEWDDARAYATTALDYFPTDYRLYLFLLLEELKAHSIEELENSDTPFVNNKNYKKVKRFADVDLVERLEAWSATIEKRNQHASEQDRIRKEQLANEMQNEETKKQEERKEELLRRAKLKRLSEQRKFGEYKGTNTWTPSWFATEDRITYKKKDYLFQDMSSFTINKEPNSEWSAGQIFIQLKTKRMPVILAYRFDDKDRVKELVAYARRKVRPY